MNDYILSVLLGIVEGLTEFLPVSSTAHLRISEALLGISLQDGFWKMYSIVIQLGAILALPVFFSQRILKFIRTFPHGERGDHTALTHPLTLTMIAFFCTAIPAYLLKHVIEHNLESITVMAWALLVGGIVMWLVDWLCRQPRTLHVEEMSLSQALAIGFTQILAAVVPGTSRSMSTIAAGQLGGMSRAAALEFSFFLSIPTMVAATGYDLLKTIHPSAKDKAELVSKGIAPLVMDGHHWVVLAIGFVISFIVALGVVAWFMRWVQKHGFLPFAIYRIVLAILLLCGVFGELMKH